MGLLRKRRGDWWEQHYLGPSGCLIRVRYGPEVNVNIDGLSVVGGLSWAAIMFSRVLWETMWNTLLCLAVCRTKHTKVVCSDVYSRIYNDKYLIRWQK